MILARSVERLTGFAPLLLVRPGLQQICEFGAHWASDHAPEAGRWVPFRFVTQGVCVVELNNTGARSPPGATVRYCSTGAANYAEGPPRRPASVGHSDAHEYDEQCAHEIGGYRLCTSAHAFKLRLDHAHQHAGRDATDPLAAAETISWQAKEQNDDAIPE
jgi:hypothetical protein